MRERLDLLAGLAALVWRAARMKPLPSLSLDERLKNLPIAGAPVRETVTIGWDEYALPVIEAVNMSDLAVGLGVVHAHLRLGQMEIMRHLAQGRLSELVGPAALPFDAALRCLDLGRAAPAMIAMLPAASRSWAENFLAGVNHVVAHAPLMPPDCVFLGIGRSAWTMLDLMAVARLACADITWAPALKMLRLREGMGKAAWQKLWPELMAQGLPMPAGPAAAVSRGSNSAAVSGARSASGHAMIASDPHVGLQLPSIWLAASMAAPGFSAAGLMIPGLPTVAIGRNGAIAWGATSLHAGSSVFVDLAAEADPRIHERVVDIAVRGAAPRRVVLRESRFGPVISDCKIFGLKRPTALAWVGHRPSDELTAMLAVNQAKDFSDFQAGLKGFALQGYSFTYADRDGGVGIVRAAHVPLRTAPPDDLVEPAALMDRLVCLAETEAVLGPADGVVVSANEDPGGVQAGFLFSPPDRARRLAGLLAHSGVTRRDLERLQTDVMSDSSVIWRDRLAARAERLGIALPAEIMAWDGGYDALSAGALGYEILIGETAPHVVGRAALKPFLAGWAGRSQILTRLLAADDAVLRKALRRSVPQVRRILHGGHRWGGAHRLRLMHPLARLPLAGRVFGRVCFGVPGSGDTIYKMGHDLLRARRHGRHGVSYGASARHVADFADADGSFVVILGGQDGWTGSVNATDQIGLWQAGEYLTLPLSRSDEMSRFFRVTRLGDKACD